MNSEETVGKYLARAKTLVKSKLKEATAWHHDIDKADAYPYATESSRQA